MSGEKEAKGRRSACSGRNCDFAHAIGAGILMLSESKVLRSQDAIISYVEAP
jgi:hypothetical protein